MAVNLTLVFRRELPLNLNKYTIIVTAPVVQSTKKSIYVTGIDGISMGWSIYGAIEAGSNQGTISLSGVYPGNSIIVEMYDWFSPTSQEGVGSMKIPNHVYDLAVGFIDQGTTSNTLKFSFIVNLWQYAIDFDTGQPLPTQHLVIPNINSTISYTIEGLLTVSKTVLASSGFSTAIQTIGQAKPNTTYTIKCDISNASEYFPNTIILTQTFALTTLKSSKPTFFNWINSKNQKEVFNLTAAEWLSLQKKIDEWYSYTGRTVYDWPNEDENGNNMIEKGKPFKAELYNVAVRRLGILNSSVVSNYNLKSNYSQFDQIKAEYFNNLRDAINALIEIVN